MHAAIHTMTETKPEENMAVIFNEILEVIHCHTAFYLCLWYIHKNLFFFLTLAEHVLSGHIHLSHSLCLSIYISIYIYTFINYIFSLAFFWLTYLQSNKIPQVFFRTHNIKTTAQCGLYKSTSRNRGRMGTVTRRAGLKPWLLTSKCRGTLRQTELATDSYQEDFCNLYCQRWSRTGERRHWWSADQQDDSPHPAYRRSSVSLVSRLQVNINHCRVKLSYCVL